MGTRRFKIIVTSMRTGQHYKMMRRAQTPNEAINKAVAWLGMDSLHEPPFQVFVEAVGEVRHG